jgi:hypothetical protein
MKMEMKSKAYPKLILPIEVKKREILKIEE